MVGGASSMPYASELLLEPTMTRQWGTHYGGSRKLHALLYAGELQLEPTMKRQWCTHYSRAVSCLPHACALQREPTMKRVQ